MSPQTFGRLRPPVRRVLAVDGGSRRLKLLLAESDFGRLRILKEELVDLPAEGLVSPEEIKSHLQTCLEDWDHPPVAVVIPQHLTISQVIDLPLAPESEVDKLIADETIKLSGVSESRMVYDFVRTEGPVRNRQQFWITFCQETDIRDRVQRLGIEPEDLCEVTTTANSLIAAHRAGNPLSSRAILIHLGAQTTVVVILLAGQGAFATSFPMGGDFFTRALARQRQCTEETAEALKREKNLLVGPEASKEFAEVVDGWAAELKRQLTDWFQQNPGAASETPPFDLIASGGGFDQPGLLEYLQVAAAMELRPWPKAAQPGLVLPGKGFEVVFGAALQALGHSHQPVSLLPENYRAAWKKRLSRQRVELASFALVAVCLLLLGLGTWQKLSLIHRKGALLDKVKAAQEEVAANDSLTADLVSEYENVRPVLAAQQNTMDVLNSLALLQQSRSNRSYWYVLLADQQSYFSLPPALLSTNRISKTNLLGAVIDFARASFALRAPTLLQTNIVPRPGFIAELCVPGEAEAARQSLSELVNGLKHQPLFSRVDLLSDDLRRNLAEAKVVIPDRHYVLALEFAQTDFQQPVPPKKTGPRGSRRLARPLATPDLGTSLTQTTHEE
jgi:Tfp pilus assembly PilM family ATPase